MHANEVVKSLQNCDLNPAPCAPCRRRRCRQAPAPCHACGHCFLALRFFCVAPQSASGFTLLAASVQASSGSMSRLATATRAYTRSPIARFGRLRRCRQPKCYSGFAEWHLVSETEVLPDRGDICTRMIGIALLQPRRPGWAALRVDDQFSGCNSKTLHYYSEYNSEVSPSRTRRPRWAASRGWGH